jgi:CRISPR-associated protein (TIGR03986 family)
MSPKHIQKIEKTDRIAKAPYNFVELPDKVVEAELPLPEGDHYHSNNHTGRIECTLTTESPLYIRCGMTPANFTKYSELPEKYSKPPKDATEKQKKQWEEEKKQWETERKTVLAPFFTYQNDCLPVLPGSSLRGMLRTLVEIVSFGKIDRVSDEHRLFFRAVAANKNKESWGKEYKKYVEPAEPEKVKAGYLKKDNQGWYIQPATTEKDKTFAWVRETSLSLQDFKQFNDKNYQPQYIPVSYERADVDQNDKAKPKRLFAHNVKSPEIYPTQKGVLVTSGNMKQKENESSPRCNHCVVFAENKNAARLPIDPTAIDHYRNALTDFQKGVPFDKDWGLLKENIPVFYCPPEKGKNIVGFFGQSPNFRIPYSPEGNGHATTVVDFIPKNLRKSASIDLADAIFGWVKKETKDEKMPDSFDKQRAGRVFFTDGLYQSSQNEIWYQDKPLTPQILSEPKPTCFPHYLVQPKEDNPDAHPSKLKHYASQPVTETVIRGHKLYWHKGSDPDFKLPPPPKKVIGSPKKVSDTQTTLIKPINKGVSFKFSIHFENLSKVELGVLLWVLDIAQDDRYRLKLGMGKPLGLGAVKIEHKLYLSDRQKRYSNLFSDNSNDWKTAETLENDLDYKQCFESYILEKLQHIGKFEDICRIKMLLTMLTWTANPCQNYLEQRRYMEIECDPSKKQCIGKPKKDGKVNEYSERRVLPNPLDVMNIKMDCDRPSPPSPQDSISQPAQRFSEGQEIEAKVVDIKVQKGKKLKTTITYEIEGSDCLAKEEIYKHTISLAINDVIKVSIIKTKGESIRTVKQIQ